MSSRYFHGYRDVQHVSSEEQIPTEKHEGQSLVDFVKMYDIQYVHLTYTWSSTNTSIQLQDMGKDDFHVLGSYIRFDEEYSYTGPTGEGFENWYDSYGDFLDDYIDKCKVWKLANGVVLMAAEIEREDFQGMDNEHSEDELPPADEITQYSTFGHLLWIKNNLYYL